jgi:hypothetical protein
LEVVEIAPASFEELQLILSTMINRCREREASGFNYRSPHLIYDYHLGEELKHTHKSCDLCVPYQTRLFSGDEAANEFTNLTRQFPFNPSSDDSAYPNVHYGKPGYSVDCGCELILTNKEEGCAKMLAEDLRSVTQ